MSKIFGIGYAERLQFAQTCVELWANLARSLSNHVFDLIFEATSAEGPTISGGPSAAWLSAEVPQTVPANLVVAWCRSRKLSADQASGSGVAHFSCRRPQVVAGDNLGALTGQLGCRESAKGVDAGQLHSRTELLSIA